MALNGLNDLFTDVEHRGEGRQRILEDHADVFPADGAHVLIVHADELAAVKFD